ncbi:MAG: DUF366 family protein [Deltaproteobacteria bacterium]|jgi:uncharacterized protein|nr:DUF366 family protein [Deltaproteobacteria bacterium]
MKSKWINDEICYIGTQLRSGWVADNTALAGDAIASFIGPADVPIENMVDMDDVANDEPIYSKSMLHFIIEHPGCDLPLAVARQRIITAIASEVFHKYENGKCVTRRGDDLFEGNKKISVSIATTSPVSSLIHFAINVISDGTPLPTKGLSDFGIEPRAFSEEIMNRYMNEIASMEHACGKVKSVP